VQCSQGASRVGDAVHPSLPQGETMHTDFVENMLTVHKKYRDLIQEVFQGNQVNVCTLQCSDCIPAVQAFVGVAPGATRP
jgi:hypothetical protein